MPNLMRFINQDIVTGDISNSNSLNRYTYVEGNPATMIDPFGLCAESVAVVINNIFESEKIFLDVKRLQLLLKSSDWNVYDAKMVLDLYAALVKYDITSCTQVSMFLGECELESQYGEKKVRTASPSIYSGTGYIQMTGIAEYYAFATYLMINEVEEVSDCDYYHPGGYHYPDPIGTNYNKIVDLAKEKGVSDEELSRYTNIVDIGKEFVGENYAWESSAYYWTCSKKLKNDVDNGASIDEISRSIKYNASVVSLENRKTFYTTTEDNYKVIFGEEYILGRNRVVE